MTRHVPNFPKIYNICLDFPRFQCYTSVVSIRKDE